jgi:predicted amidophosphoribosyltransferase
MLNELTITCPHCGAGVPAAKAFCPHCSEPMESEEPPARASSRLDAMPATVIGTSLAELMAQMEREHD